MKVQHLGYVGKDMEKLERRFFAEGAVAVGEVIADPVQGVHLRFVRQPDSGELWELIVPSGDVSNSPLRSRIAAGGGLDHIYDELSADDGSLDEVLSREIARGALLVCPPALAVAFNRRIAFVFRRSGRLIEFIEARTAASDL